MNCNRRGPTVIELVIVFCCILAIPVILCGFGLWFWSGVGDLLEDPDVSNRPSAEANAEQHFAFTYPDATAITVDCLGTDPEGDGYTVCSGDIVIGGDHYRYMAECSGNWPVGALDRLPDPGCK